MMACSAEKTFGVTGKVQLYEMQ